MTSTQDQIFHKLDLEQGTTEWLDWRHSGIGASEASTVMGDNRFSQSPSWFTKRRTKSTLSLMKDEVRYGTRARCQRFVY